MAGIGVTDEWTGLLGGLLVAGAGVGLLNPVIADVALKVVPREQSGMAAGINDTFRQVGIAVGVALWGAIFLSRGADKVAEVAEGTTAATGDRPRQLVEATSSGNLDQALGAVPPGSRETVETAAREGFLAGLNDILLMGAGLSFAGALFVLWLVREHEIEKEPAEPGDACREPRCPPSYFRVRPAFARRRRSRAGSTARAVTLDGRARATRRARCGPAAVSLSVSLRVPAPVSLHRAGGDRDLPTGLALSATAAASSTATSTCSLRERRTLRDAAALGP